MRKSLAIIVAAFAMSASAQVYIHDDYVGVMASKSYGDIKPTIVESRIKNWYSITNRPTTVSGYGITDDVAMQGWVGTLLDETLAEFATTNDIWTITNEPLFKAYSNQILSHIAQPLTNVHGMTVERVSGWDTAAGWATTNYATGTPVYVEIDGVWTTASTGYVTRVSAASTYISSVNASSSFVEVAGDTMTGALDIRAKYTDSYGLRSRFQVSTNNVITNSVSSPGDAPWGFLTTNDTIVWDGDTFSSTNGSLDHFYVVWSNQIPAGLYRVYVDPNGEYTAIDHEFTCNVGISNGTWNTVGNFDDSKEAITAYVYMPAGIPWFLFHENEPADPFAVNFADISLYLVSTSTWFQTTSTGGELTGTWKINGSNISAGLESDPIWSAASNKYLLVTNNLNGFEMRARDYIDYNTLRIGDDSIEHMHGRMGLYFSGNWYHISVNDGPVLEFEGDALLTSETDPTWTSMSTGYLSKVSAVSTYVSIAAWQAQATNYIKLVSAPASNTASGARGEVAINATNLFIYYAASSMWFRISGGTLEW